MAVLSETEIESLRVLAERYIRINRVNAVVGKALGAGASAAVFYITDGHDHLAQIGRAHV